MSLPKAASLLFTLPLCTIGALTPLFNAVAQVSTDGTVSTTVTVTGPDGKTFNINDGTTKGTNLFHSFKEFSVPTGGSANFNNAANIQNIISRVTGPSISNIDGLISTLNPANLFLLNPNGIVFGPNASLKIGGSFFATTANSFVFDNGYEFSATDPQAPLLTINIPIGLRYRDNPGDIKVEGPGHGLNYNDLAKSGARPNFDSNVTGLQVEPGKTLALVGGNVFIEGGVLKSKGGRIEIGSIDSNQFVNLVPVEQGLSLDYEGTSSFRDIQFSNQAFVNVTGDGGGSIAIQGKNISVTSESNLLSDTLADKDGGDISIVGDSIVFNRSGVTSNTFGSGKGGQIILEANNIKLENNGGASIQTWDKGDAGNINISANSLEIKNQWGITSITTANSTGKAGDINITVNGPMAIDFVGIRTDSSGRGDAGKININANSLEIKNSTVSSRVTNTGQAGEIKFKIADSLDVKNSRITTDTFGTGDAGKININANSFRLQDGAVESQAGRNSTGKGGEINITAGTLELPQSAGISTTTFAKGDAGEININADSFLLQRSRVRSNTQTGSTGNAGEVNITAGLFQINSANVQTVSSSSGKAGNLKVVADTIKLDDSSLRANTTAGEGNITLNSGDLILRDNSSITTNATGTATGGNITINTDNLVALEDSNITANAEKGFGGRIFITAQGIFRSPDSDITAFSELGRQYSGTVQLNTPETDPSQGLIEFPETVTDPAQQIAQNPCLRGGGEFIITGRGGFPTDPSKVFSSDNVRVDLVKPVASTVNSTSTTKSQPSTTSTSATDKPIVPARGWIFNEKGEVTLVAYDPTKTGPQRSPQTPANSCSAQR